MTPPMQTIDPIHDASSTVIGPEIRGEFSDCRSGREGAHHAIPCPCENVIMFTEIGKWEMDGTVQNRWHKPANVANSWFLYFFKAW